MGDARRRVEETNEKFVDICVGLDDKIGQTQTAVEANIAATASRLEQALGALESRTEANDQAVEGRLRDLVEQHSSRCDAEIGDSRTFLVAGSALFAIGGATAQLEVAAGGGLVDETLGYELRDHGRAALSLLLLTAAAFLRLALPALLLLVPALSLRPAAPQHA